MYSLSNGMCKMLKKFEHIYVMAHENLRLIFLRNLLLFENNASLLSQVTDH